MSKSGCHGNVKLDGQALPCQIVPRSILGKVTKFGGFSLLMKKVINVQSECGHNRPLPPPGLNRVKGQPLRSLSEGDRSGELRPQWVQTMGPDFLV